MISTNAARHWKSLRTQGRNDGEQDAVCRDRITSRCRLDVIKPNLRLPASNFVGLAVHVQGLFCLGVLVGEPFSGVNRERPFVRRDRLPHRSCPGRSLS